MRSDDPNVLLGLDAPDDAAIYRISDELALVQTVDFFTPIVDDPYAWGAIAATNALSDVYAMGGEPKTALNLVGWPREGLSFDLLAAVLEGAVDKVKEAGASVVGGHTIDDAEPKFGLAVTGFVHPARIMTAAAARPGDLLLLTKPLGTGLIATALKRDAATPAHVQEVVSVMTRLNKGASEVLVGAEVACATDVTGFGFLGHLIDMCLLSGVSARVTATDVPSLPGALALAAAGMVAGGTRRNQSYFGASVAFDEGVPDEMKTLLFDAQTSGGLLAAVSPAKSEQVLAAMAQADVECHVIGEIEQGGPGTVKVSA